MDIYYLIYGLGLYLVLGAIALRIPNLKWRAVALAILNVVGIRIAFRVKAIVLAVYIAMLVAHYGLMITYVAFGAWFPIVCIALLRYLPASVIHLDIPGPLAQVMIGYSYVAFRQIWVTMEFRNGQVKKPSLAEYFAYCLFMPAIPVGPITRYHEFNDSLQKPSPSQLTTGFFRVTLGFIKVYFLGTILSRLSYKGLFGSLGTHGWIDFAASAVFFYLYLYCNFSGFCDIVLGISQVLGLKSAENFDHPFRARNLADFWNRWHISLSVFMRDLVFSPVSRFLIHKLGMRFKDLSIVFSMMLIFLLIGIWHGGTWGYLIFGLMHGAGVAANYGYTLWLRKKLSPPQFKSYQANHAIRVASIALTFSFVTLSLFFFANSDAEISRILHSLFGA